MAVNQEASHVLLIKTKHYPLAWHPEFQNQYIRGRKTLSIISMNTLPENPLYDDHLGRERIIFRYFVSHIHLLS